MAGLPRHPQSGTYVGRLWTGGATPDRVQLNVSSYTFPVYEATALTRLYPVVTRYNTNINGRTMPWDPAWRASAGTDGNLIVLDPATGREWNLWQVKFSDGKVRATNGSLVQANLTWSGYGNPGNYWTKTNGALPSRGCGIQYLAMLVRPEEIAEGVIRHAVTFPIPNTDGKIFVAPATKLEHPNVPGGRVPEGMRFALRMTDAEISAWVNSLPSGLGAAGKRSARIIATAARDYGWFITDTNGGGSQFQLEDNLTAGAEWTALGLGKRTVSGREYPRHLMRGLLTRGRIYAIVPSDHYPR